VKLTVYIHVASGPWNFWSFTFPYRNIFMSWYIPGWVTLDLFVYCRGSRTVGFAPPPGGGGCRSCGVGGELFVWGTFLFFNEIWAQDKIYILVGTLLGWNMKLALLYNLFFTNVYINLEKYVIHELNFMANLFIWIYSGGGDAKFMRHVKGRRKI
jgi:hypothetical protein